MKNIFYVTLLSIVLIASGTLLFQKMGRVSASPYLSQIGQAFNDIVGYIENSAKTTPTLKSKTPFHTSESIPQIPIKSLPQATPKPITKTTTKPLQNLITKNPTPKPVVKSCYRFTVPHLDGSSSNLCYSQTDYNQLFSLYSQYTSAKGSYEYQLRVAEMYSDPPSEFFQKSADEAKHKAQEYKDKMGEIALAMYNIELRGY